VTLAIVKAVVEAVAMKVAVVAAEDDQRVSIAAEEARLCAKSVHHIKGGTILVVQTTATMTIVQQHHQQSAHLQHHAINNKSTAVTHLN